jgi:Raf kinase inhibitor-like YbhB/YbcL family protein
MLKRWLTVLGLCSLFTSVAYAAPTSSLPFNLASTSFADHSQLPLKYTCDGQAISPELHWSNVPTTTKSLVLIVSDPDAPGKTFYHWIVYNIPPTVTSLTEAMPALPAGAIAGKNSMQELRYKGACPPKGEKHRYIFSLYALDAKLALATGAPAESVLQAMQGHLIEETSLLATFKH